MYSGPLIADDLSVFIAFVLGPIVYVFSLRIYRGLGLLSHAIAEAIAPSPAAGVTSPLRGARPPALEDNLDSIGG